MFELVQHEIAGANIKVIGVGGGGTNAIETMIMSGLHGVDFIVANTDKQALDASSASIKLQFGTQLTRGLGAGANPDVGRAAALEDRALIEEIVSGADMVFVTAGMGGGTGTGGAPIVAEVAREAGALTVAVVTKPFHFEGKKRLTQATNGLKELSEQVDTLIVIPNQRLLYIASEKTSILETFKKADEVLLNAVKGITDLINIRGLINLDFADVRTVMSNRGLALMGSGVASGEHRAVESATKAISSPLLEDISIKGATGIIINITGGSDLTLFEVNEASTLITEEADEEAEIIFGAVIDESLKDEVRVTVIATGFRNRQEQILATSTARRRATATAAKLEVKEVTKEGVGTQVSAPEKPQHENITTPPVDEAQVSRTEDPELPFETQRKSALAAAEQPVDPTPEGQRASEPATEESPEEHAAKSQDEKPEQEPEPSKPTREDDLKAARRIAKELGINNLGDEEYDIPTFLRRPPDKDV